MAWSRHRPDKNSEVALARNKDKDRQRTRELILNRDRPRFLKNGTVDWLGDGKRRGGCAEINYKLLDGATMTELLMIRSTKGSVKAHFQRLKDRNGLLVRKDSDGKWRFSLEGLGISRVDERFVESGKDLIKVALVKIAPGEDARYWEQCLNGDFICVGWDEMGDLSQYRSQEDFQKHFERTFRRKLYGGRLSTLRQKGNELWMLTKLQAGDRIIANKGNSEVLAVGIVKEPGYRWLPTRRRDGFYHTVTVHWDVSAAKRVSKQAWNQTVTQVRVDFFNKLTGSRLSRSEVRDLRGKPGSKEAFRENPLNASTQTEAAAKAEEESDRAQGFQSNPKIRKCVEEHAMQMAIDRFEAAGYRVEDCHKHRPYDLLCTKGGHQKFVEVKGTQTDGSILILTSGEVEHIARTYPNSLLCLVHGIKVTGSAAPRASGGTLIVVDPLVPRTSELHPINYRYTRQWSRKRQ
jgi:Protein NO VEIN, C-terminal